MKILAIAWAILCIVAGSVLLLNVFGIVHNVPIFELTIAFVLIALGIKQFIDMAKNKE